jgi:hypothetical protein
MMLLHFAPMLAAGLLAFSAIERRRLLPASLVVWPAIAGLSCFAFPRFLELSFFRGVIGTVHPLTVGIFASTVLFALASTLSFGATIRWAFRPDRPSLALRILPALISVACFAITVWAAAHGFIGLRTWAY